MTQYMKEPVLMQRALSLGERGRITAPPNPWVGCVIVKNGEVVGEGFHVAPGMPHAEIVALEQAGERAKDAEVYVSLEPCCHFGRTPPCVEALIKAKVAKVYIPILDPDPRVSGQGVKKLEEAGIKVEIGLCADEAQRTLAPYLHHRTTKLPYTILKTAQSLDGKVSAEDGTSQWITGEMARADVQKLRAESQAILIGAGTARIDQPRLTVRNSTKQPLRVVLDSKGRLEPTGPLFDLSLAPTLIFTTTLAPKKEWGGVEVITLAPEHNKLPLAQVLSILGERNILQLLVEGGPTLHASLFHANLFDQISIYTGNCLLGETAKPAIPLLKISTISKAPRLHLSNFTRFDHDFRCDYTLAK